ncbi:hypothetical protein GCM10022220_23410 [Actinocatenispora rupis]|uniref:Uncharacterized protein n=1 Tax=Actinocatenispora rupis TaxID=519421 RepID=A0A8J3IXJ6_9ACTN|nr:hypothetical protein Aru02nite_27650 [Actinocatenispora rupis]
MGTARPDSSAWQPNNLAGNKASRQLSRASERPSRNTASGLLSLAREQPDRPHNEAQPAGERPPDSSARRTNDPAGDATHPTAQAGERLTKFRVSAIRWRGRCP